MPMLHDAAYRAQIQDRVRQLGPDSERKWGKMSVDQMLWHVNEALDVALGHRKLPIERAPLPRPMLKFLILNLPWVKSAPTVPGFRTEAAHDFAAEHDRCLRLIDEFGARNLDGNWDDSPVLGRVSGTDVSRLQAKHLDHHLKQFGL